MILVIHRKILACGMAIVAQSLDFRHYFSSLR